MSSGLDETGGEGVGWGFVEFGGALVVERFDLAR